MKSEIERKLSGKFAVRDLIVFRDIDEIIERLDAACERENLSRMRGRSTYNDDEIECYPLPLEEAESKPTRRLPYKR
ncbi:hypothetical protein [Bacillus cereus]|uniref:hypothetical protein n=1 Tax=Bacillus cereus TaxID=1396 RepID=UPI001FFA5D4E|nr:hypothetical protein [Bacillus cereus]MDA1913625.1 hypothetical protein [Bacillus cereus]MDA2659745.1 hypothetical protein [Bacillus cereus]